MSALRDDLDYSNPEIAVPQAIEQRLLRVHTSIPGIVQSYNSSTRRAKIQTAIKMFNNETRRFVSRAPLVDVPVHTPSAGDYILHTHLKKHDAGQVLFSERGMTVFKQNLVESNSDRMGFHSEKDAVYFPGYGPAEGFVAIDDSGIAIQHKDGTKYTLLNDDKIEHKWNGKFITIDDDKIRIEFSSGEHIVLNMSEIKITSSLEVEIEAPITIITGNLRVNGNIQSFGTVENNNVNVGSTHIHVAPAGGGPTTPPG